MAGKIILNFSLPIQLCLGLKVEPMWRYLGQLSQYDPWNFHFLTFCSFNLSAVFASAWSQVKWQWPLFGSVLILICRNVKSQFYIFMHCLLLLERGVPMFERVFKIHSAKWIALRKNFEFDLKTWNSTFVCRYKRWGRPPPQSMSIFRWSAFDTYMLKLDQNRWNGI